MDNFVIFRSGMSGGTATLAIRIARYLSYQDIKVHYLFKEINNIDNYNQLLGLGVYIYEATNFANYLSIEDQIIVLTFSLEEHAEVSELLKEYKNKVIILYPVQNGITGLNFSRRTVLGRIEYYISRCYFRELINKGVILFTTETLLKEYREVYKIEVTDKCKLANIPMEMGKFNIIDVEHRYFSSPKIILSVLRAEFPLRGYIFPLIDWFTTRRNNNEFQLRIISYGESLAELKEYIAQKDLNQNIELIEGCSYNQLLQYIKSSFVLVGHGTSVLDANSIGVPAVVAVANTYSDASPGLYSKVKDIVGFESNSTSTIPDEIEALAMSDFQEYVMHCKNGYQVMVENNSIKHYVEMLFIIANEAINGINSYRYSRLILVKTNLIRFFGKTIKLIKRGNKHGTI